MQISTEYLQKDYRKECEAYRETAPSAAPHKKEKHETLIRGRCISFIAKNSSL